MSRRLMSRRLLIGAGAVIGAVAILVGAVLAIAAPWAPPPDGLTVTPTAGPAGSPDGSAGASRQPLVPSASLGATPPARPAPGHEVYGYVPYWEFDDTIARHVAGTDLTTLLLFSVTTRANGTLDTAQAGYRRISGSIGEQLIREARARGVAVQLVFSSFTARKNAQFFGSITRQDKAIPALVGLAARLGVDEINVDVELIELEDVPAYGAFLGRLRAALQARIPGAQVSVATTANPTGAGMAAAAVAAGVDRVFMMAYDYHWPGSGPGASSPMMRRDGEEKDLIWSLDLYEAAGIPPERTILGLPLYGMRWPVSGPDLGAGATGRGRAWIPNDNLDFLASPPYPPERDPIEVVEFYRIWAGRGPAPALPSPTPSVDPFASPGPSASPGSGSPAPAGSGAPASGASRPPAGSSASSSPAGSPGATPSGAPSASPAPTAAVKGWQALYLDSPETLAAKLAVANERGLAGAGFWAIGYERGLPGYTALIAKFQAGQVP